MRWATAVTSDSSAEPTTPGYGRAASAGWSWQAGSVPLERIDHVQLAMPCGGEDVATAFYAGLLGLTRVPKPAHLAARGGCWFERGGLKIHLGVEEDFRPARKAHPALQVSGLAELADRLRSGGADTATDEPLEGYDRLYVYDPFGNRIELLEPLPPG